MDIHDSVQSLKPDIQAILLQQLAQTFPNPPKKKGLKNLEREVKEFAAISCGLVNWRLDLAAKTKRRAETLFDQFNEWGLSMKEFVQTPIGYVTNHAWLWAFQDALISISEASRLTGLTEDMLLYFVENENLVHFIDPFESDPQKAIRVIRSWTLVLADEYKSMLKD